MKNVLQQESKSLRHIPKGEKPQNGLKGLKYWKQDLLAGLVVSFVATPVSIGIAIASGAPPIAGLVSAIVAGFILPLFGGSYVTISGPAAGLAPVLYSSILALSLGHTANLEQGFHLLLPVIFLMGLFQVILSQLKVAKYSKIFPIPVIEGMMASIGLMIIFKQVPLLIGHKFLAHEFWGIVLETPSEIRHCTPEVFALGAFSLGMMILLYALRKKIRFLQTFPPQLVTVIVGTLLGLALHLDKKFLISLPANPLANAMQWSNFQDLMAHPGIWTVVPGLILALSMIDGIESLATITAVDKIDPYRRQSSPDRTLLAMGASNMVSSLAGGLTLIPEILRSSTSILAGGKTQWANFCCAFFVMLYLLMFRDTISLIPLTVLSAVVIYTGYTLCKPVIWKKIFQTGLDQFFVYVWTIYITVSYDLMWGILSGVLVAIVLNQVNVARHQMSSAGELNFFRMILDSFVNPVSSKETQGTESHIYVNKPVVCTNFLHLIQEINAVSAPSQQITVHFLSMVKIVDHTAAEHLAGVIQDIGESCNVTVRLEGLEQLRNYHTLGELFHLPSREEYFDQATVSA